MRASRATHGWEPLGARRRAGRVLAGLLAGLALATPAAAQEGDWPTWRGPGNRGVATGGAPTRWSLEENLRWSVAVPGRGCSTPAVVGSRVFLTTAIPTEPTDGNEEVDRGRFGSQGPQVEHAFCVLAFDRATGRLVWQRTAALATPSEGFHGAYGSFASASPASDGERLIAWFGDQGVFCYDLDGQLLWSHAFDAPFRMRNAFGTGTPPVLAGELVLLNVDHEGDSFLLALDRRDGSQRWRVERDEVSTWAPPLPVQVDGRWQVVVAGTRRVRCYDLGTGELAWECAGLGLNCIPAPVQVGDQVLVMSGYRNQQILAIRLGGRGDLTETDHVVWRSARGCAYTASPVLHGNEFYTVKDGGFVSCFDARTGEPHYLEERLPRGMQVKASPLAVGERLYVLGEEGRMALVRMGPTFAIEAVVPAPAEGAYLASPVVAGGELYLRSTEHLYCFASP